MLQLPTDYLPLHPEVETFLKGPLELWIGGRSQPAETGKSFQTFDPSSGTPLASIAKGDAEDIEKAVLRARQAFDEGPWRNKLSAAERARMIWRLAELMEARADILGQLDSLDNGKPFETARDVDVHYAAEHFRYYAGWPTKFEGATIPVAPHGMLNYTLYEPVGVCGLIVPWNYPLLMAAWKIAPALAAGNCIILKPAEQTPLSALYLARLFEEAGFPPGVFNVVTGFGETAGAALVEHPGVDKIGFTGSAEVARQIVRDSADNLKRVSLELGGKSPNIVFADADIDNAIQGATWAIFGNNGQSCTAGSRLYIERRVFEKVVEGMAAEAARIEIGPGMRQRQPQIGPVISQEQLDRVLEYVDSGHADGGEAVIGAHRITGALGDGYFVAPTIFVGIGDDSKIAREEIFGPVVCAMPFDDPDEVLRRANDTNFGLAAGLWTKDLPRAHRFARTLKAGTIWINTWGNTDAASPSAATSRADTAGRWAGKRWNSIAR